MNSYRKILKDSGLIQSSEAADSSNDTITSGYTTPYQGIACVLVRDIKIEQEAGALQLSCGGAAREFYYPIVRR
jgi:hypothetical protein